MLTAAAHLANKPEDIVFAVLIVALVCFVFAGVIAWRDGTHYAILIAAGLAFFVLAFIVT